MLGRIKKQVERFVTGDCRQAFIDNNFGDPRELLLDSINNKKSGKTDYYTYTIVSAFALNTALVRQQLGISSEDQQQLSARWRAPASTANGVTVVRPSIFNDSRSIEWNITHEFFHCIGYPGHYYTEDSVIPGVSTVGPVIEGAAGWHDLSYVKNYQKIIDACVPGKK